MVAKDRQNTKGSPKVEVGEIDTRAPFQSVKDAVNLFGEGAFSGEKPAIRKSKPHSAERVLARDTQLHVAQKELGKLKDRLKSAETTKSGALVELQRAKRTLEDLNNKLKIVNEAKETSIRATEDAKNQARQLDEINGCDASWKQELETAREQYSAAITELDSAKQELRKFRQDCEANSEVKAAAFKQVNEADNTAKVSTERAGELSKEISFVHESIGEVKVATMLAQKEQEMIFSEKDGEKQRHKAALEETARKMISLKKEIDPELTANLESQLADTMGEIDKLKTEMESAKASDLDSVKTVTFELDGAKESLHKVAEAENLLKNMLESLKMELEKVKKEHSELKEKEAETEAIAGNLHVKLRKSKSELETAFSEEAKVRGASEEMIATLQTLSVENENAKNQAEEMKKEAEELKKEAEMTRNVLKEAEKTLEIALMEVEEAKADEAKALDEIKRLSERTSAARASTSSESGSQITISREEFESLSGKVEEYEKLAEMKVEAAMAQVEAVKASENEAVKKLASTQKEIDEIKGATEGALKRVEMDEAAKKAIEGELRKWRERDQKKAEETASRILLESAAVSAGSSPAGNYRSNHRREVISSPGRVVDMRKLEKAKSSVVPKKVLLTNFSGIFHRKRSQVDGGASPSYLPGERPV